MATFFGLVAVVLGVVSLGYAVITYVRSVEAESWPKAEGTITHASLKHTGTTDGDDVGERHESRREWYVPVIQYTYTVAGRAYRGNRIVIGEMQGMDRERAAEYLDAYREGAKVSVAYDRANPSSAVLEARVDAGPVLLYAAIGLALIGGTIYAKFFFTGV